MIRRQIRRQRVCIEGRRLSKVLTKPYKVVAMDLLIIDSLRMVEVCVFCAALESVPRYLDLIMIFYGEL